MKSSRSILGMLLLAQSRPRVDQLTRSTSQFKFGWHSFRWAFQQIFSNDALRGTDIFRYPSSNRDIVVPRANRLIVLEEDIEIAPDFFGFFGAMVRESHPSLTLHFLSNQPCITLWAFGHLSFNSSTKDRSMHKRFGFVAGSSVGCR